MHDITDPQLAPCIIGTARRTWNDVSATPEPLDMWEEVARSAADDVDVQRDIIGSIDHLGLVHCQSWAYDEPVRRLADRLATHGIYFSESILAGTSPQRLLDEAAERMLRGECSVALVVGGEALATRSAMQRRGETPNWSNPHPSPPALPIDFDEWYLPTERSHGVLPAWLTFALLEQARWAARGATSEDRNELGEVMARLSTVAAANPDAWFRTLRSASDITQPSTSNRMIASPYTKLMTSFMGVNMAAANLMVTRRTADAWGVPEDRRAYLRGWGFARDAIHLGARNDLSSSQAMTVATHTACAMASMSLSDIDVFDLYSCFGSAVQFARDALGLRHDDPRPISLTGGLPYHGGPSSNYMGHSISHLVDYLRANSSHAGMVTGVGMHMTKHVAAIYSPIPGPILWDGNERSTQQWRAPPTSPDVTVVDHADGRCVIRAATVVHASDGSSDHAIALCELPDGTRCYARSDRSATMSAVTDGSWANADAAVTHGQNSQNLFEF
jgi:acetyl-CoA C-acetyltransferase